MRDKRRCPFWKRTGVQTTADLYLIQSVGGFCVDRFSPRPSALKKADSTDDRLAMRGPGVGARLLAGTTLQPARRSSIRERSCPPSWLPPCGSGAVCPRLVVGAIATTMSNLQKTPAKTGSRGEGIKE